MSFATCAYPIQLGKVNKMTNASHDNIDSNESKSNNTDNVIHLNNHRPYLYRWEYKLLHSDLPSNARFIGLVLTTYMNSNKHYAFPSLRTLKKATALSINTIRLHLKILCENGFLSISKSLNKKTGNLQCIYAIKLSTKDASKSCQGVSVTDTLSVIDTASNEGGGVSMVDGGCINGCYRVYQWLTPNNQRNNQSNNQYKTYTQKNDAQKFNGVVFDFKQYDFLSLVDKNKETLTNDISKQNDKVKVQQAKKEKLAKEKKLANTQAKERFDIFWQAYPKKKGKAVALKSFLRINPTQTLFDEIMKALNEINSRYWKTIAKQFIPDASTWLNQERWQDEIIENISMKKQQTQSKSVMIREAIEAKPTNNVFVKAMRDFIGSWNLRTKTYKELLPIANEAFERVSKANIV